MGKHDIRTATTSEEHLLNRIKDLEKRLAFAAESNAKLIKENAKWQKWFQEHDSAAQDKIAELEAEVEKWKRKALSLVDDYVQMS